MTRPDLQRVVFSLQLELDVGHGPPSGVLICPLESDGNTLRAIVLGKRRMIDVRAGDTVHHAIARWKVNGVKA